MGSKSNNTSFASKSGASQEEASAADSFTSDEVTVLQAIAAETPNYVVATTSSGAYNTTSTSFVDVPNVTVDITVGSDDSLVEIGLISDGTTNQSYLEASRNGTAGNDTAATYQILRDGVVVSEMTLRNIYGTSTTNGRIRVPPSSLSFKEVPTAGTYTYKLRMKAELSGQRANVFYVKMYALEIRR